MTVTEAFDIYDLHVLQAEGFKQSTRKNYLCAKNSLNKAVGDLPISYLGKDHIIVWKLAMRNDGNAATTINTNLSKLRQVLKWCAENEMRVMDTAVIKRAPEIQKPKTFLTPDEVRRLKEAAGNVRDAAIIDLYFATGGRLSEVADLDVKDFTAAKEVKPGLFEIWVCGKGDKYRPVVFPLSVKESVDAYLATRKDNFKPLFMSRQNNRLGDSMIEKMVHRATRDAGLDKHVTPHILRHSFTSDMIYNNAPISAVSAWLGHKDSTVTQKIYTHINPNQSQEAYLRAHSAI